MASRSARGIFLYPRTLVITKVAMTKPVITIHTDTIGRALARPDVQNVFSVALRAKARTDEHRRRALGE
jgi:hypothetical protein